MKITTDQATDLDWDAEQIKKFKIGVRRAAIIIVLAAVLVLIFLGFLPHPYEYFHDSTLHQTIRVNKLTGTRQLATSDGWKDW